MGQLSHVPTTREVSNTEMLRQAIKESLDRLPPMPAVVTRIMELTANPNCTARELQKVIGMDEVLSSKVLRLVNSARYGFPKRISTLSHAVILLGFETIRNLAIGAATVHLLRHGPACPINRLSFWEHSLQTALAASSLAKHLRNDLITREEVFLAGLLHDIGVLFLSQTFPEEYRSVVAQASSLQEVVSPEQEILGIDHCTVGALMAEQWNLPPVFSAVMQHHHEPQAQSPFFFQTGMVYLGNVLSQSIETGEEPDQEPELPLVIQNLFNPGRDTWAWCRRDVEMQMDAARDFLHILHSP